MMALTLRHPWPAAVCRWGKRVENRTWAPPRGAIGKWFGLHAGAVPTGKARLEAMADLRGLIQSGLAPDCNLDEVVIPGMVGVWRLDRVVSAGGPPDPILDSPWFSGPYGWVIGEVVVFPEAIPCKGAQGLWEIPANVHERMRLAWKEVVR